MSDELFERIDEAATRLGMSRSDLTEEAILRYLLIVQDTGFEPPRGETRTPGPR